MFGESKACSEVLEWNVDGLYILTTREHKYFVNKLFLYTLFQLLLTMTYFSTLFFASELKPRMWMSRNPASDPVHGERGLPYYPYFRCLCCLFVILTCYNFVYDIYDLYGSTSNPGKKKGGGGGSAYTFGYRRLAGIFKVTPLPPFINSIFLKPYPFIYFVCKLWPNHIFYTKLLTCSCIVGAHEINFKSACIHVPRGIHPGCSYIMGKCHNTSWQQILLEDEF